MAGESIFLIVAGIICVIRITYCYIKYGRFKC